MRLDTHHRRDWIHAGRHFALDASLWAIAFVAATTIRFHEDLSIVPGAIQATASNLVFSALIVASSLYVSGMYALHGLHQRWRFHLACIAGGLLMGLFAILALGSIDFSARIGRGILGMGLPLAGGLILGHHFILHQRGLMISEISAAVVTCPEDEVRVLLLKSFLPRHSPLKGCFTPPGYLLHRDLENLGSLNSPGKLRIANVYFSRTALEDECLASHLRQLRYSGMRLTSITSACEEACQAIPLVLIDGDWLIDACGQPEHYYVAKIKRCIDVAAAFGIGILSLPLLGLGMLLVRLTSPGPVFFSQERVGRFHRPFQLHKLRTMRVDAESDGPQWSGEDDPRVTFVGRYLRKFRIDEIPQLWNILKGEMSFVGPRPERPQFVEALADEIPYYRERHLVRPGLTGWAQVCYPYGASIEDARRKLEFDLYYLKHMGVILDLFIFLDTVKIIFRGGASRRRGQRLMEFDSSHTKACLAVYGSGSIRTGSMAEVADAPDNASFAAGSGDERAMGVPVRFQPGQRLTDR